MKRLLLLGDEAVAQGGIDAGISGFYGYPGTPSTEIIEYVQRSPEAKERNIHREWSVNEKTAMEAALGMSYAGKRAIVTMKHVGLNVAADAFVNSAITGVNGGLIVAVADDPSMHSSQNEQDSRYYGKFAFTPILEPSNQQEAYDMVHYGFELSEKYQLPVLLRLTTRIAHSRGGVQTTDAVKAENKVKLPDDPVQFVLLPSIAKKRYANLLTEQPGLVEESDNSPFNKYFDGSDKSLGIIASGIAFNYLMENCPEGCKHPVVKISQYPLPYNMLKKLFDEVDEVLVLEEGYPFVEEQLRGYFNYSLKPIKGRLDGTVPRTGELNPNIVAQALGQSIEVVYNQSDIVRVRPPQFCDGCGHIFFYKALNEVMEKYGKGRVFADIGCYTLAALSPFNAINSCVDMGASVTMAKGAADAGLIPSVAVIGDSTFTHSGITGLLDAVRENTNMTLFILDNSAVGMTGGQKSAAEGKIEDIVKGLGVDPDHIRIVNPIPKEHQTMVQVFSEEIAYPGLSVVIPRRECVQTYIRRIKMQKKAKAAK